MKKWVLFSDLIFTFFVVALPALCLLRYFRLPIGLAFLVAGLFGIAATSLFGLSKTKKEERLLLRRGEEKQKQMLLTHLALLSPEDALRLLYSESPSQTSGIWYIEREEKLIFSLFLWRPVQTEDLIPIVRVCLEQKTQGEIVCGEISPDADAFLAQFSLERITGEKIYEQLKEENRLPESYLSEPYFTKKKKRLPRIWFAKQNSRRFFVGGVLLLLSSFFVPFPYYYILFGCFMTIAALLIRVFGYR
ncbi:MAG: hypothetical protein IJY11_01460 [Clostridia bacterium]|nr:hypothetical protein [Clostridia bacterium]